ncbi:DUF309 domain-containing protein [Bacillus luteolus]|uniref:DUF309 domain-containing protein n=1 Tax=Litchfieldia luteola TaxID=682179 RepID=A0ABR9QPD6_9BACI|nr:DUF309 domain-containing protein [Cytobacillus luteolus]MBE4910347.1 DUF309 domain-containing protein [Cytobacillus luteolus]MBP1942078.1 putative metal-dependent hydrolase [Cytobacillus luteolus]
MYPEAYRQFLFHFHGDRDYFECHEVLEEYWKEDAPPERKQYWVGLIQLAVGLYHQRRENFSGAYRMIKNSLSIIKTEEKMILKLGIDYQKLITLLEERLSEIKLKKPYTSINLPITDNNLLTDCIQNCKKQGLQWGLTNAPTDEYIINKHKLRDRSDVIEERDRQMEIKKKR